ncbi:hypothetical protein EVAR_52393_1 [Eumeta japonica]|uniref:Uncharacterized protein n=1 Tax=Eumeta variegata TaxID=151549 RepID=A0A4C1ZFA6_EUMVA|nr:hypothetical protein EVAR_52393_1 [Eumeta japonica]
MNDFGTETKLDTCIQHAVTSSTRSTADLPPSNELEINLKHILTKIKGPSSVADADPVQAVAYAIEGGDGAPLPLIVRVLGTIQKNRGVPRPVPVGWSLGVRLQPPHDNAVCSTSKGARSLAPAVTDYPLMDTSEFASRNVSFLARNEKRREDIENGKCTRGPRINLNICQKILPLAGPADVLPCPAVVVLPFVVGRWPIGSIAVAPPARALNAFFLNLGLASDPDSVLDSGFRSAFDSATSHSSDLNKARGKC